MRRHEAGFALILAILTLMLLTFLGLTLATTTSTELQIATNYRWSQQALYNAEAGLELAKGYLIGQEWRILLPAPRTAAQMATYQTVNALGTPLPARADQDGNPSRNWENFQCDTGTLNSLGQTVYANNEGYGVILDAPTYFVNLFQNVSQTAGQQLNGTFTVWLRRANRPSGAGQLEDDPNDNVMVLTAEGTAPFTSTLAGNFAFQNRAVRILEQTITRIAPGDCENYTGQVGSGPTGAGFDQCDPVRQQGIIGGVTEITPNAN